MYLYDEQDEDSCENPSSDSEE